MPPARKRPAAASSGPLTSRPAHYKNSWERLVESMSTGHRNPWYLLRYEPLQELPKAILQKFNDFPIQKSLFMSSHTDVEQMFTAVAAYIVAREIVRTSPPEHRAHRLNDMVRTLGNKTFARIMDLQQMVAIIPTIRLTNIDNRWDRGSYRQRFIIAALLLLATRRLPQASTTVLTGAALSKAATFVVLTGGPGMCTLLRRLLQVPWLYLAFSLHVSATYFPFSHHEFEHLRKVPKTPLLNGPKH